MSGRVLRLVPRPRGGLDLPLEGLRQHALLALMEDLDPSGETARLLARRLLDLIDADRLRVLPEGTPRR